MRASNINRRRWWQFLLRGCHGAQTQPIRFHDDARLLCGLRDGVQRLGFPTRSLSQPLLQLLVPALEAVIPTDHVVRITLAFAWCLSFTLLLRFLELCPKDTAATSSFPQMSWVRVV